MCVCCRCSYQFSTRFIPLAVPQAAAAASLRIMSAAGMRCPACGSTNIVDDDLYSQAQLVCVDCGSVVSEGVLANDPVGGSGTKMRLNSSLSR